jgi:TM2 domain-containing membrane protein YozV
MVLDHPMVQEPMVREHRSLGEWMLSKPKDKRVAVILALAGAVAPIAGWHKFYMGQPVWGVLYCLMSFTPIPRVASALEAVWYLSQDSEEFHQKFNTGLPFTGKVSKPLSSVDPQQVGAIAEAVRQLDQLRSDGLISEYEFEQKRRQLLDHI